MYDVTETYNAKVKDLLREIKARVHIGQNIFSDEIISIKWSLASNLKTSIIGNILSLKADIEFNNKLKTISLSKGDMLSFDIGITIDDTTVEYVPFQEMFVDDISENNDNKVTVVLFDTMQYFNSKSLNEVEITFPITVRKYVEKLCEKVNLQLSSKSFYHDDLILNEEPNFSGNELLRDVLSDVATFCLGNVFITRNNQVEILSLSNKGGNAVTKITANEYGKFNIKQLYGPINSIVLSRTPQEDNIYRRDEESIKVNGLHELKIENNTFMDRNRDAYIDDILLQLNGFQYMPVELEWRGNPALDCCDLIKICDVDDKTEYNTYILANESEFTGGLKARYKIECPGDTSTNYKKATNLKERIKNAEISVDKVSGEIKSIVENTYTKDEVTEVVSSAIVQTKDEIVMDFRNGGISSSVEFDLNGQRIYNGDLEIYNKPKSDVAKKKVFGYNRAAESLEFTGDLYLNKGSSIKQDKISGKVTWDLSTTANGLIIKTGNGGMTVKTGYSAAFFDDIIADGEISCSNLYVNGNPGGIIYGSVSNRGYYLKFPDGTMIQYHRPSATIDVNKPFGSVYYGVMPAISFPLTFINNEISLNVTVNDSNTFGYATANASASGTSHGYIYSGVSRTSYGINYSWMAIGRWM